MQVLQSKEKDAKSAATKREDAVAMMERRLSEGFRMGLVPEGSFIPLSPSKYFISARIFYCSPQWFS
jgi:hypothetical protein